MSVAALPAETQKNLVNLYNNATKSDTDRAKFANAMRIAHGKGWPYRTLGSSIGLSYEMVRIYTTKDPDTNYTESDLGFEIPPRAKPIKELPLKDVPQEVVNDLQARLNAAISGPIQSRQDKSLRPEVARLFAGLAAAEKAGWDRHSVGRAIGVHPQAVGRFIQQHTKFGAGIEVPSYTEAPSKELVTSWDANYPRTPAVVIPEDVAKEMHALQEEARDNRGNEPLDATNPALDSARKYTSLLGEWYLRGASRAELERATGQGWEALRMRLSRWGYMTKPNWTPTDSRQRTGKALASHEPRRAKKTAAKK